MSMKRVLYFVANLLGGVVLVLLLVDPTRPLAPSSFCLVSPSSLPFCPGSFRGDAGRPLNEDLHRPDDLPYTGGRRG
jgi:hypothetical protein